MEEQKKLPDDFWTATIDIDPFAQNPEVGAELDLIANHETELGGIVEQMWKDMVNETKLLEGMEIPEREELTNPIGELPVTIRIQELSPETNTKE